jgi:hypothetical protein
MLIQDVISFHFTFSSQLVMQVINYTFVVTMVTSRLQGRQLRGLGDFTVGNLSEEVNNMCIGIRYHPTSVLV